MVDQVSSVNDTTQVQPSQTTDIPEQFKQRLLAAGVPQNVIDSGKSAVHAYIEANPEIKAQLHPQQAQKNIFEQQQAAHRAHGPHKGHHKGGNHKAELQTKAQELMQQNPEMTEQEAIQTLIAQFKAEHAAKEASEQPQVNQ